MFKYDILKKFPSMSFLNNVDRLCKNLTNIPIYYIFINIKALKGFLKKAKY